MSSSEVKTPARTEVVGLVLDYTANAIDSDRAIERSQLSEDTALVGSGAVVDSLGLVQIISDVEDTMADDYAQPIDLTDERALSQEKSPFRTVGTLVDHVMTCLGVPAGL